MTESMGADQVSGPEPRILGLSLIQYAAVEIGIAEGFALSDVLTLEGVDIAGYPRASGAWAQRLEALSDDDPLALDDLLDDRRARARERYGRRIEPLDADLRGFLGFIQAWSTAEDQAGYLAARGMRTGDVLRLQSKWLGAIGRDPALQTEVDTALRSAINPDLVVRVHDPILPEPTAPPLEFIDLEPPPPESDDEDDEPAEADLAAVEPVPELFASVFPGESARSAEPPTDALRPPDEVPRMVPTAVTPEGAPARQPELPSFLLKAQAPPQQPPPLQPPLQPPPQPAPLPDLGATSMVTLSPFFNKVLPFKKEVAAAPNVGETRDPLAQTSAVWSAPKGGVLPFGGVAPSPRKEPAPVASEPALAASAGPVASASPPPVTPTAAPAQPDFGATVTVMTSPFFNKALPFKGEPVITAKADKAQDPLARTSAVWSAPKGGVLPFAGITPSPSPGAVAPTLPIAAPPDPTLGARGAMRPVAQPVEPVQAAKSEPASRPAAPTLTLPQYASLCAELNILPQQTEQVFHRYGLMSPQHRVHLDLLWQERLRRDPAAYREWQALYHHYRVYWADRARQTGGK